MQPSGWRFVFFVCARACVFCYISTAVQEKIGGWKFSEYALVIRGCVFVCVHKKKVLSQSFKMRKEETGARDQTF